VFLSHLPRLEHSAEPCAESSAVAESLHAGPSGQVLREQSVPVNPVKHEQTPQGVVHLPFPEQELGQGVYWEDEAEWARMMRWRAVVAIDMRVLFFHFFMFRVFV